jgi:hypothetical protein
MKKGDPSPSGDEDPGKSNQWLAFLNLGWLIMLYMLAFAGGGLWLAASDGGFPGVFRKRLHPVPRRKKAGIG